MNDYREEIILLTLTVIAVSISMGLLLYRIFRLSSGHKINNYEIIPSTYEIIPSNNYEIIHPAYKI